MYYRYNGVDLNKLIKIKSVDMPMLPGVENSTIDIWERQGSIFNAQKQQPLPITIHFILRVTTEETNEDENALHNKIVDVKNVFRTTKPRNLYLGSREKYIKAIPIGEPTLKLRNPKNKSVYVGEVKLMAYDPAFYSLEAKVESGEKLISCENEGNYYCYPIINIGISKDSQFVQVENTTTNKKILVGNVPTPYATTIKNKSIVLDDECESIAGWSMGSINVDSNRSVEGTLALTDNGKGLKCGTYGSGNTVWKGVSARKNLDQTIQDFYIECVMAHNSSGVNGDPTVGKNKTHTEEIKTGTRTKYYEVVGTTNVRTGPSTKYKKVGTLKKGTKITPISVSKSWLKFTYNGTTRYASTMYMKVKYKDNTTTVTRKNFVTKSATSLRTSYNKTSKLKCTISAGKTVRLISSKKYLDPSDKKKKRYYYKLAEKYDGMTGYVAVSQVYEASDVSYEYDEELETADDKTGIIEIYGYSINHEKIFRMGLYDDDPYWEFTYPLVQVGSQDFLKDKTIAPAPKISTETNASEDKLTVKQDTLLSGQYGDYNDFYGKIGIQREGKKWKAWVYKIKNGEVVKRLLSNETTVNDSPTQKLAYLVLYIGTQDTQKASGCALYDVICKNINPKSTTTQQNVKDFEAGDVLKIDCYNSEIKLNDKTYNKLDIGSQFFELVHGVNEIKVRSDDPELTTDVLYNERWNYHI